jgi:hypothetical protein
LRLKFVTKVNGNDVLWGLCTLTVTFRPKFMTA